MLKIIDKKVSARIEVLRFPLIVLVVFIHNYANTVRLPQGVEAGVIYSNIWVDFARLFISQGIARVAVPLFFLVSGYLFFVDDWSWTQYANKLKKRLRTLLIPYLFWDLLTFVCFAVAPAIPQLNVYFSGIRWPPMHSFVECVNAFFNISVLYLLNPISYQFWFIRDLLALVVLAPAIYFLLTRRSALPFIAVLFCWWFFSEGNVPLRDVEAALCFSLGAYFSLTGKNVTYLDRFGPWTTAMFAGLLTIHSAFPDLPFIYKLMLVFGVPSLWWFTELATKIDTLKSTLIGLSGASFFVFAAHEPLLTLIRKLLFKLLSPTNAAAILALYFLIPICLVMLLVAIYWNLLRTMPSFLAFITGSFYRLQKSRS